ncbi:MAG: NAD(P)-binding domain-containing protein [Pseudomonadota bacterium]
MRIGIVGSGNMGRVLGGGWALHGHEVFFGARDPDAAERAAALARAQGAASVQAGSNRAAAVFGEVVLYCPRNVDPAEVVGEVAVLDGKVVIDLNNWPVPDGGFAFAPVTVSLAEKLQAWLPRAHVVKAFNTMAQELFEMDTDSLRSHAVSAFLCADHAPARDTVAALARELGLAPVDMGPLRNARIVEPMGDVIRYLILAGGLGPFAALKVERLPVAATGRFGGRKASGWWAANVG